MEKFPKLTPVNLAFAAKTVDGDQFVVPLSRFVGLSFNDAREEVALRLSGDEKILLAGYTPKADNRTLEAMVLIAQRVYKTGRTHSYDSHKHAQGATIRNIENEPSRRVQVDYLKPCGGGSESDFVLI